MTVPDEFRLDIEEVLVLAEQAQRNPELLRQKAKLIEAILRRLSADQYPNFKARLLADLGSAYRGLRTGDLSANLLRAIGLYEEALRLRPAEVAPFDYARLQNELGSAYWSLRTGDRAANLDRAIRCYKEALRFQPADATPVDYSMTMSNLGAAYAELHTGDRSVTLQLAIAAFVEALRFLTVDANPIQYASAWSNLGSAYQKLPTGDRDANLQQAISCFEAALGVFTAEAMPFVHATILHNVGTAYLDLLTGDREANLRVAIRCYAEALRFRTAENAPLDYALTQTNLGNAYRALRTGDRAANRELAIGCYHEAVRFRTGEATPLDYAETQDHMATVYAERPIGDRVSNLQLAIAGYLEALRVRSPDAAPLEHALTRVNLGCTYRDLARAGYAPVPSLYEAIACLRDSVRFLTPESFPRAYAMVQNNLGTCYLDLPVGERGANLRLAISCYREALRFRTADEAPLEYALTQNNLGTAYEELASSNGDPALEEAIRCYRRALRFRTIEASPIEHRITASNLGNLHFARQRWAEAHEAYASAVAAGDLLYLAAGTERARQVLIAAQPDIVVRDAYCLARLGRFNEAVVRLEAGRTRALTEALTRDHAALDCAAPSDRAAFIATRKRIWALEAEVRAPDWPGSLPHQPRVQAHSFSEVSADLRAARHTLAKVAERIGSYVPEFMPAELDVARIAEAVPPDAPLAYVLTTSQGGLALIVPPNATSLRAEHAVWLDDCTRKGLNQLLVERDPDGQITGGFLVGQVTGDPELLKHALDQTMPEMRERVIDPLAARLAALGFTSCTLVCVGLLSLVPLHAVAPEQMMLTCAPSARALRAARKLAAERADRPAIFIGIANPLPSPQPLAFADGEVKAIARLVPPQAQRLLSEQQASLSSLRNVLPGATHIHFACHGTFDVRDPLASALFLAGGETITLRDLLDGPLDLSSSRLAVLSACQTSLTDFSTVPDEAIGLPAGFLQAGLPAVIGTLWPVNDFSTQLLMERFYRNHLLDGMNPASALRDAQLWLRAVTARELKTIGSSQQKSDERFKQDAHRLRMMRYFHSNPESLPFAHPYYWAPFVLTGAGAE